MVQRILIAATLVSSLAGPPTVAPILAAQQNATQTDHAASPSGIIPFTSNGCTGFREARFFSCCYAHDMAYWTGGTRSDRTRADRTLRGCLREISHDPVLSFVGWGLVRLAYVPGFFCCDGWSRAWRDTTRGRYAALTPDEQRQVVDEKRRICQSLTLNPATGKYRLDDARELRATQATQICGSALPGPSAPSGAISTR